MGKQQQVGEYETIEYKRKMYLVLEFPITNKGIGVRNQWVRIAGERLADALDIEDTNDAEAIAIDDTVYHYIDDDVLAKGDITDIAKNHLDEEFEVGEDMEA